MSSLPEAARLAHRWLGPAGRRGRWPATPPSARTTASPARTGETYMLAYYPEEVRAS